MQSQHKQSEVEVDEGQVHSTPGHGDLTLMDLYEVTDCHLTDLHTNLLANQEHRLADIRSELLVEMAEVRSVVTGLCDSLEFTQAELQSIKETVSKGALSVSTSMAVERLKSVEEQLSNLDNQVDYIENQTRCNNV